MKILFERELAQDELNVLYHTYLPEELEGYIQSLLASSIDEIITRCRNVMLSEVMPDIKKSYDTIPTDDAALVELIISSPTYQDAATKVAARENQILTELGVKNETVSA